MTVRQTTLEYRDPVVVTKPSDKTCEPLYTTASGEVPSRSVERERAAIEKYLQSLAPEDALLTQQLAAALPSMDSQCRIAVTIPAYHEAETIEATLRQYAMQRKADGTPLEPFLWEITVIVNREKGIAPDATMDVIERFAASMPGMRLHALDVVFPKGKSGVGAARKLVSHVTLLRSLQREQHLPFYLESEDADLVLVDPQTISRAIDILDRHPHIDGLQGKQDRDPRVLVENDTLFLATRARQFFEILMRDWRYRPHRNPGADPVHNQIMTSGWNFAMPAEVYANIGGHEQRRCGEDVQIGIKISLLRSTKNMPPETRTVTPSPTRSYSDPRRMIRLLEKDASLYACFGTEETEQSVRSMNEDEALASIRHLARLTMQNRRCIESHLRRHLRNMNRGMPGIAETHELFRRLMFHLGFARDDYQLDNHFNILNVDSVCRRLDEYRQRPLFRQVFERQGIGKE